ncbi:MAG TPA: acyl-CoA dehydrogenase, partial [Roseateles sp.]
RAWALRTRAASDECAQQVLRAVTRAMGAGPLCHDEGFARLAADLPVFIRQCHGDRDLVALGHQLLKQADTTWTL